MPEKTLEMRFVNEEKRIVTIRLPSPKENITSQEVSAAMDELLTHSVFSGSASVLASKEGARIVSRAVDPIPLS
ncbi:DUF2922 domain-containing protein [Bacillus piscicola]|uniref:DUF2922 domain-containing protein n=1 Tax=Bacillus piscicola TaxID=1632684 RepID=UPI001F08A558|nr:DUF2922 domain-containing protein [Bacillus piscicola]